MLVPEKCADARLKQPTGSQHADRADARLWGPDAGGLWGYDGDAGGGHQSDGSGVVYGVGGEGGLRGG